MEVFVLYTCRNSHSVSVFEYADVFDEKEELPEPLSDQQNEYDSLDDDPTWSPEELERA